MKDCVLSVFGINPYRIGGTEIYARELSRQLADCDVNSVLCFSADPAEEVREYLTADNVFFEKADDLEKNRWKTARQLWRIIGRHRPSIVHYHYIPFVSPYPWVASLHGARHVFFTNHASWPAHDIPRPAPFWKRVLVRIINWPITGVAYGAISSHG